MKSSTSRITPRSAVAQLTEQLLETERARSERLLNTVRSIVLLLLAFGAAVYSPSLTHALNTVNVAVLLPMLCWTLWQQIVFRRGTDPRWLSSVNGFVDTTALSVLLGGYAIMGSPLLAVTSPMVFTYIVIISAQPLTGSAHRAAAVAILAAAEYAILIGILVFMGHLTLGPMEMPPVFTTGDRVTAPLIDQIARVVFFLVAGGASSYAALRLERVLRDALIAQVERSAEEKELAVRLQEADQLAAIGTLATTVAHEVSTPLSSISMLAEFLEKSELTDAQRQDVNGILEESRRTSDVVRALLKVVYRPDPVDGPISLTDIVTRSVSVLRPLLREQHVEATTNLADGLPAFSGQSGRLEQAVLNIILNAVEAMDGGPRDKELSLSTGFDHLRVWLTIEDTGPGFGPAVIDQIFDRFFTTKSVGKGTGLGLWIAREIVTNHGGVLTASNRSTGGARFDMVFSLEPTRSS